VRVDWVRLQLDVATFDEAPFAAYAEAAARAGLEVTTLAEAGDTTANRRAVFELNRTCSGDIPGRAAFYTFEEYVAERFDSPSYDPAGMVVAVDDGAWVGMAATSLHDGYAFSDMTGVLRSHRGRGLSLVMKLLAIRFVREQGLRWLRTFQHPDNAPVIAMNRRLGFVDEEPAMWVGSA
jgi:GNAT superfamily N-acetyltransferase